MKSAYELAMERLNAEDPQSCKPLSEAQKGQLAAIDAKYQAKVAEREIFLKKALEDTLAKEGDMGEADRIRKQIAGERALLEEEKEEEKNKVRAQ